jgi:putative transposase
MDCLNTHQSEALVRLTAQLEPNPIELGCKGKSGILHSMITRSEFLADPTHRLVVHFTPKHCSWMNQIEIWFSILVRKLLRRGNFSSTDALKTRILEFVEYFNRTMAKPFKWTYKGKPLCD